jgi:hypothetical protein
MVFVLLLGMDLKPQTATVEWAAGSNIEFKKLPNGCEVKHS